MDRSVTAGTRMRCVADSYMCQSLHGPGGVGMASAHPEDSRQKGLHTTRTTSPRRVQFDSKPSLGPSPLKGSGPSAACFRASISRCRPTNFVKPLPAALCNRVRSGPRPVTSWTLTGSLTPLTLVGSGPRRASWAQSGGDPDARSIATAATEACLRRAIEIARGQRAQFWELLGTTSLARFGATAAAAMRRTRCSRRSTTGSLKASTPPT
jgi:hypothetical protein